MSSYAYAKVDIIQSVSSTYLEIGSKKANNGGSGNSTATVTATLSPGLYLALASQNTANSLKITVEFEDSTKGEILHNITTGGYGGIVTLIKIKQTTDITVKAIANKDNWCYSSCVLYQI